jgi:hypothetical protein
MTAPGTDPLAEGTPRRRPVDDLLGVLGGVLLPCGLVLVFLGWYGAAHTAYLFEQIPYLISGGVFGIGLILVAGLLYLGSWVSRTAAVQRATNAELLDALRDIREELGRARPATSGRSANGARPSLVATRSGSMLHRPDCSVVAGRADLRSVEATGSGLSPCQLCDPLAQGDRVMGR